MPGLSKSKYTIFRQCAKALWLKANKPELEVIDDKARERFRIGNEVGDLAMGLFGDFVEVTAVAEDGSLDLNEMVRRTQECIAAGTENIAEASFLWNGNYCAVDILHRAGDGYAIYEVKSSTGSDAKNKNTRSVLAKYVRDIAYQKFVLGKCGVNVTGTYLVRLNSGYFFDKSLDIHKLFHITDVNELVEEELGNIEGDIRDAMAVLSSGSEPDCRVGNHCLHPYGCAFAQYCMKGIPTPSVFDLYDITFKKAADLYYDGKVTFDDIPGSELTPIQRMQVECTLKGEDHIDKPAIRAFLKELEGPLYFLDFETMQPAVPLYQGTKPYQQVTFQYSLHWIEQEGGELKHTGFLAESGTDPRRALAEKICKDIPMNVRVTAYNMGFECTRLRELADMYPDLAGHLRNIADNIVDLLDPFQNGYYYTPAMGGSFSIKSVLPALFPDDPELNYHNLDERCQNGGDAMSIFPKIKDMAPEEQLATRNALLEYCRLDTYAMVKVWQKLVEVSK